MYKVLIVDDEPIIQEGLSNLVYWEEHGLEIAGFANNGQEAIDFLNATSVHILITDIKMPHMDGLALIRAAKAKDPRLKCIIMSGYNDFPYVKEAALLGIENYLLKPIDENELIHTLVNTVQRIENEIHRSIEMTEGYRILKENILLRWITGEISSHELRDKAELLNIDLNTGDYAVALMALTNSPYESPASQDLLRYSMNNVCHEIVSERGLGMALRDLGGNVVILLGGDDLGRRGKELRAALTECIDQVHAVLKAGVFVTVGMIQSDYRHVYKSYQRAGEMQDYRLILGGDRLVFSGDIPNPAEFQLSAIQEHLLLLSDSLRTKDLSGMDATIDDLFDQIKSMPHASPAFVQSASVMILLQMINTVRSMNSNTQPVFDSIKDIFSGIYQSRDLAELTEWLKTMSRTCLDILNAEDDQISPLIRKVMETIQIRYAENINLKTVAADFRINSFYLGQLFKKETGEAFNTYLNKVRIHKAKQLLASDQRLRTAEVAAQVGYLNTNYFFTIFRKFTGLSPTEFRSDPSITN